MLQSTLGDILLPRVQVQPGPTQFLNTRVFIVHLSFYLFSWNVSISMKTKITLYFSKKKDKFINI